MMTAIRTSSRPSRLVMSEMLEDHDTADNCQWEDFYLSCQSWRQTPPCLRLCYRQHGSNVVLQLWLDWAAVASSRYWSLSLSHPARPARLTNNKKWNVLHRLSLRHHSQARVLRSFSKNISFDSRKTTHQIKNIPVFINNYIRRNMYKYI